MVGSEKNSGKAAILEVIRNSLDDACDTVKALEESFRENVKTLRIESSEYVFTNLMQNIRDLQFLLEFLGELRAGMVHFEDFGIGDDPIIADGAGVKLFSEMNSAFAAGDWVALSDIIEYELTGLLQKEEAWLRELQERVEAHEPVS
jgi:hypothetical protein